MARDFEPDEFIGPREASEPCYREEPQVPQTKEAPNQPPEDRGLEPGPQIRPDTIRSPEIRRAYELRDRSYRLRSSEITAMVEVGKFRIVALEDLKDFAYHADKALMRRDLENLIRQGLVQMKSVPHEERGSRHLLALTKNGHRLLTGFEMVHQDQVLYHGFTKLREAHHDADLYRLYQKAAGKIERAGGRNLGVVLDYELKKRVYRDLAKLGTALGSAGSKRTVAERHGLQVVREKIPFPDVRIEYDAPDGERAHVDIELATSHYRLCDLVEKLNAGFSMYAHAEDVTNLRRVLDQQELAAEILTL